jgi:hypothetical protein
MRIIDPGTKHVIRLKRYPILQVALATVFHNILNGIFNERPVHIGIDSYAPVKEYHQYQAIPLDWWIDHIAKYEIVDCSIAALSVWFRLAHQRSHDVFEEGHYFYSSRSGSFEIETNARGLLSSIFVFFDGKPPAFLKQLFHDFPSSAYPTKAELLNDMTVYGTMNEREFLEELEPIHYQTIEIE